MSRRHRAERREVLPDPKFGNMVVSKFMNSIMYAGKKSVAEKIVYGAFDMIESKTKQSPVGIFEQALAVARAGAGRAPAAIIRVAPYRIRRVGVLSTMLPGLADKVIDKTLRVTQERLAPAGAAIVAERRVPHETAPLARALAAVL